MSDINDEVHAIAEHLRRLNLEFDRYGNLTAQSADAVRKRTAAEQYRDAQLEKSGYAAAQSLQNLGKAVGSYTSAMYEGQRGSAALNATITQVTSGLSNLAIALAYLATPGGPLKKLLVAGVTALGAKTLEVATEIGNASRNMVSQQMDAYQQLSKSGAAGAEGLYGIGESAAKVGVSIFKMDKYLSLIAGDSGSLSQFGQGVNDGRRRFEALGDALKGERETFKLLGMDQDAMNEGMMGYIRMLNMTGRAQTMNTNQLKEGTKKYLLEQDALTRLTGMQRKEVEDLRAQAMQDERFNANITEMRRQGPEGNKQADELEEFNAMVKKIAPGFSQGIQAMGDMSAPGAVELDIATGGRSQEIIELAKHDKAAALDLLTKSMAESQQDYETLAKLGASGFAGSRSEVTKLANLAGKSYKEIDAKIKKEQNGMITGGVDENGKPVRDERLLKEVKLLDTQQETNILLQRLINEGFEDKIFGGVGADSSQATALKAAKAELDFVKNQVRERKPRLLLEKDQEPKKLTVPEAEDNAKDANALVNKLGEYVKAVTDQQAAAQKQLDSAKAAYNAPDLNAADKRIQGNKLDQAQTALDNIKAERARAEVELNTALKQNKQAADDLVKAKEAASKAVKEEAPKEKEKAKDNVPPAGETEEAKQARIKKETEAAEKSKAEAKAAEAAKKAADEAAAKKEAEDKSKAKETARITRLPGPDGARVLDDVLELVKQGVPVVSNVRTQEEQDKLKDHQDEKGNWFTKNNLPVAEDSKHLTGDAIDVRVKDMTKDLEKLLKDSGWMRPLPKSDPGHWQRVPKKEDKKTSETGKFDFDLAKALSDGMDMSDVTAGLTINSDVATVNSKGMNVSLDDRDDINKMLAAVAPGFAESFRSSSQTDQSAAKANFESSMGDVKSALSEQKATNVALLDAMQELIRIQRNSVDVQQKIYNVTA